MDRYKAEAETARKITKSTLMLAALSALLGLLIVVGSRYASANAGF